MSKYKFRYEKNKKKGTCPACGKPGVFRYYEDLQGNRLNEDWGRCDREGKCGYQATPSGVVFEADPNYIPPPEPVVVFPEGTTLEVITKSLVDLKSNFHEFARKTLHITDEHLQKWLVGTNKKGMTGFIMKNAQGNIMNVKWIRYNPNGKRGHDENDEYSLKQLPVDSGFKYAQCLYGEHLLPEDKSIPVIVVESEKTAVIASFFYPAFTWIGCGSCNGLTEAKIKVLEGRRVYWLADADKAGRETNSSLKNLYKHQIKHKLVDLFPDRNDGWDIADAIVAGIRPELKLACDDAQWVSLKKPEPKPEIVLDPEEQARITKEKEDAFKALQEEMRATVIYHPHSYEIEVRAGKAFDRVAEDFLLYIKYKTEDEYEQITWILELKTAKESIFVEVVHEDFCSARRLKNLVATKRLSLKITDTHLDELRSYLFRKTEFSTASKVLRYGYHVPSGVYFFSNVAIVGGQPVQPDEFGIVPAGNEYLSIPQSQKAKQQRYEMTKLTIPFNQFFVKYAEAHRFENAFVPICFYIFSLFRDLALKNKNFSPILFLKGGAGTGKSSMVRVLTAAFGRKQEGVNLKSKSTEVALIKLMSQTSNMMIWFDEFHNELGGIEGLLQAAYDNDGYHRSSDNTSNETNAVEIHSALALTSNYSPDNPIFFSRCIFQPITSQEKTEDQRKAFYQLEEWQEKGLACMSVELLNYRKFLVENDNYATAYNELYSSFKNHFKGENLPERLYANMAQIMAAPLIFQTHGLIQILEVETRNVNEVLEAFVEIGAASIRRQHRISSEKSELSAFLEIIQTLYDAGAIQEEIHFKINQGELSLWFPQLYNLYAPRYRQIYMKAPADKDTLQTELATAVGKNEWADICKSIRFRNDGEGNAISKTTPRRDCCAVSYKDLQVKYGLDFESRQS
ncbi:DUF6371 domain-containing protein [Siphonobacter sp. SORGH_AS_1065]|uniref:DUF6371 domain-containing protein n=1 Tax=Siphonobacter sp. SORGH_AS_1065 TaxID=3041795 RepID=UPI002788F34F|nr:DUF6371 domain-containing protein [Siphonobacter sp. SORGH_AS_1065]MDQ1085674.1 5S rRNA maturation endonuclease (ribonuclease M5) [Siphonobacter sp. SORGH_AS_1065]